MATYVTSDAHGHLRALDRALEQASPGADDAICVLGDMVDRGPDPIGVIRLVRSLPNARVLMGNHERMLLDVLATEDDRELLIWEMNGGSTTARGLDALSGEEAAEMIDWIAGLPLFSVVEVADERARRAHPRSHSLADATRPYILAHAGIDALAARGYLASAGVPIGPVRGAADASVDDLACMMEHQAAEDLLWIRESFWSEPTGLVGADGRGPVVVCGHTPSVYLGRYGRLMSGNGANEELQGCMVEVGATSDTGGVADRVCIDCSAAAGAPAGRVGVMRLEDRAVWYAPVGEDA